MPKSKPKSIPFSSNEAPLWGWLVFGAYLLGLAQVIVAAHACGVFAEGLCRRIARLRRVSEAQVDRAGGWGYLLGVAIAVAIAILEAICSS
jgi:hypothetical protein